MDTRAAIDRFLASPGLSDATRRAYRNDLREFATWYGDQPAFDPALAPLFERVPAYSVWMDGNDLVEQLQRF